MRTYAQAGVSRKLRKEAKKALKSFPGAFKTPFNLLYPVGKNIWHVKSSDGVGTKVLLAQAIASDRTTNPMLITAERA